MIIWSLISPVLCCFFFFGRETEGLRRFFFFTGTPLITTEKQRERLCVCVWYKETKIQPVKMLVVWNLFFPTFLFFLILCSFLQLLLRSFFLFTLSVHMVVLFSPPSPLPISLSLCEGEVISYLTGINFTVFVRALMVY